MPFTGTGTGIQNANDVFFSSLAQDHVLRYNSTTAKWNNTALSISSSDIANSAITEPKLAAINTPSTNQILSWNGTSLAWVNSTATDPAVGGDLTGTASAAEIKPGVVTGTELADASVSTAKLNNLAVSSNKLGNGAVTQPKIASSNTPVAGNYLSFNGTEMTWSTPAGGGGSAVRPPALVVAASNAPAAVKSSADYVCDGTNDEVQINAALAAAAYSVDDSLNWAKVELSGGTFGISNPIKMRTGTWLCGSGFLTIIESKSMTGVHGMIELIDIDAHLTSVSNLTLEGNFTAGGTSHGILYRNSTGAFGAAKETDGDFTSPPGNSPDSSHYITDVFLHSFNGTAGVRHGIYMDANAIDPKITRVRVKFASGNGFEINASSDGKYSQCIVQGAAKAGFNVGGASNMFDNCKAAFCDENGWVVSSSRTQLSMCAAQDNERHGFFISGGDSMLTNLFADSNRTGGGSYYGIKLSGSTCVLNGFQIMHRPHNPNNQIYGLDLTGSSNVYVTGMIQLPGEAGEVHITGTPGGTSYARILRHGSTIFSVG